MRRQYHRSIPPPGVSGAEKWGRRGDAHSVAGSAWRNGRPMLGSPPSRRASQHRRDAGSHLRGSIQGLRT
eukprot:8534193-Alexandrium_andersonii.AAC.1